MYCFFDDKREKKIAKKMLSYVLRGKLQIDLDTKFEEALEMIKSRSKLTSIHEDVLKNSFEQLKEIMKENPKLAVESDSSDDKKKKIKKKKKKIGEEKIKIKKVGERPKQVVQNPKITEKPVEKIVEKVKPLNYEKEDGETSD